MREKHKTKLQKLFIIFIILAILIGCFQGFGNINFSYAAEKAKRSTLEYFGSQLSGDAKKIYDAMFHMFSEGIFMKGASYELGSTSDTQTLSTEKLVSYANGNNQLLTDYGAARDAFQNDYPDCFYVDWDQLSIRVTKDTSGAFHVSLGAGRSNTYLLAGMNSDRCDLINGHHGTGIEGAVKQYEEKINEIVSKIKANTLDQEDIKDGNYTKGSSELIRMAGEAHDYIVKNMIYKHEYEVTKPQNIVKGHSYTHANEKSTSRTAYDGLIYGEGVCEAYTRTYKAILDRLGIPCICVTGVYSPKSSINEPHIWNYVKIDGKWYGVDVTHDDPTNDRFWYTKDSTHETREYFLVGQVELASHHFPNGVISGAGFEFKYPELEVDALRESLDITTADGFKVTVQKDSQFDGQEVFDSGTYFVSYEGKNYTQNAKLGKYIIVRYFTYSPESDKWETTGWSYLDPWVAAFGEKTLTDKIEPTNPIDGSYYVRLELPQVRKAQFAVTDVPPSYNSLRKEYEEKKYPKYLTGDTINPEFNDWSNRLHSALLAGAAFYTEPVDNLIIMTKEIDNPWGNYVSAPMAIKCTPYQGGSLTIGRTHHITLEFDENLKKIDDNTNVGIDVTAFGGAGIGVSNAGSTAVKNCKVSSIKWDGKNKVEFDFTPSTMFADDYTYYNFYVTGVIGADKGKAPIPTTYGVVFQRYCSSCYPKGVPRDVYAQPELIDSSDIISSSWEYKDMNGTKTHTFDELLKEIGADNSEDLLNTLSERLTLVTAEPSDVQTREMKNTLENNNEYKEDIQKAYGKINTYNIDLIVCRKQIVKTGEYVRVCLGFPEGTTYEDYAKTGKLSYKAYHYKVDPDTDKLTGEVEEIPVTVTPQGLILLINSFSPFTVLAKENDTPIIPTEKDLVITSTIGGKVLNNGVVEQGGNGIVKFKEGDSKTFTITPDEGYEIDYISLNGERITIDDKSGETVEIKYDFIDTGATLNVGFISKEVHEEESNNGLTSDIETPKTPEDTYHSGTQEEQKEPEKTEDQGNENTNAIKGDGKEENGNIPKTGDIQIEIYAAVMALSIVGIYLLIRQKRKINKKRFK